MDSMLSLLQQRQNRRYFIKRESSVLYALIFLVAIFIFGCVSSEYFLTARNLRNLLSLNVGMLILTFGQYIILLLGGVDLSVSSVISICSVMCAKYMTDSPASWLLIVALCIVASAVIGFVNGMLVTYGGLQAIIATLATQTIFAGVALAIMPQPGGHIPAALMKFVTKGWGYTVPLLIVVLFFILVWIVANRTALGRGILAVGGNEQSAETSGISADRIKIAGFILCSILAGFAGIYLGIFSSSGNPLLGEPYAQRSITAAVLGGTLLSGGKGSVVGCVLGALILGLITNILNLLGVSAYYQFVVQGALLILTLAMGALKSRK